MTRIIGIVSAKGGVGKTTTAVNLATALASYDVSNIERRVAVVDANLTAPHLCLHVGLYPFDVSLNDVLKGNNDLERAIYNHPSGLMIVPASLPLEDIVGVDPKQLKNVVKKLTEHADIIIVDNAPGLGKEAISGLKCCDEILIVVNPTIPSITDALKTIKVATKLKVNILGVVINRVRKKRYELRSKDIERLTELPVLGVIPEDENVMRSVAEKTPIVLYNSYSPASIGFLDLAGAITGREYELPKLNLFERVVMKLRIRNVFSNVQSKMRDFRK